MPIPEAIAPADLGSTPAFRGWLPSGLPNTATTSTEKGENPFGLADADVAKGFITTWSAMAGSAATADMTAGDGRGLVIDDLGGLCACGLMTNDAGAGGGTYNSSAFASDSVSSKDFTLLIACSATHNVQNITSVDADPQVLRPTVLSLATASFNDAVRICLNRKRQWAIDTQGATLGTTSNSCTARATASTQILVVVGNSDSVKVGLYNRSTGTITEIGSFDPFETASFVHVLIGNGALGTPSNNGWRGPIRGALLINAAMAFEESELPGLGEWLLQRVGTGMGTTAERKALVYFGDSRHAGCFAYGGRSYAGHAANRLSGYAVVDTVGILSATAAFWVSVAIEDRFSALCELSEMFPGHDINEVTFLVELGVNDASITGQAVQTAEDVVDRLEIIKSNLEAMGAAAGMRVNVVFCTAPTAANNAGWGVATLNAQKADILETFNAEIRARFDADEISDRALYGTGALPPSLTAWSDSLLEKVTKGPGYQVPPSYASNSTRLTFDCIHLGHDGQGDNVGLDLMNPTVRAGVGLAAASSMRLSSSITQRPY